MRAAIPCLGRLIRRSGRKIPPPPPIGCYMLTKSMSSMRPSIKSLCTNGGKHRYGSPPGHKYSKEDILRWKKNFPSLAQYSDEGT